MPRAYTVTPLLCCNLAGLALGLAILEAIYFVYILLVLEYFMKELTLWLINGLPEISIKYFSELASIIILS